MYWDKIYKKIAETIDKVIDEPQYSYKYFKELLTEISDLKSDNDGYIIATKFLYDVHHLFIESYRRDFHYPFINRFVRKTNFFTINNYGDLNTFISNIDWDSNGVPENWVRISKDIGFSLNN